MKRLLLLIAILLTACASDEPEESDAGHATTHACRRSFVPVLDAWDMIVGRAPERCRALDSQYDIVVVPEEEMPCEEGLGDNQARGGCYAGGVLYLLKGRSDEQLVDSAIHEWIHALAQCVNADVDRFHLRAELWIDYLEEHEPAVEPRARTGITAHGRCLE